MRFTLRSVLQSVRVDGIVDNHDRVSKGFLGSLDCDPGKRKRSLVRNVGNRNWMGK